MTIGKILKTMRIFEKAKNIEDKSKTEKIIIFSALIAIIAVMVHGLFDTVYFRPQIQFLFWTMAAVLNVYLREEKTVKL